MSESIQPKMARHEVARDYVDFLRTALTVFTWTALCTAVTVFAWSPALMEYGLLAKGLAVVQGDWANEIRSWLYRLGF